MIVGGSFMSSSRSTEVDSSQLQPPPAQNRLGKVVYAAMFTVVLPAGLALWALALDRQIELPPAGGEMEGIALVLVGATLVVAAVWTLRFRGGGWPMSPFPPERFVSSGVYALTSHPLYAGFTLLVLGAAITVGSPAGIWIVTPVVAISCIAFVWGFEKDATIRRFGYRREPPVIHCPGATEEIPAAGDRISPYLLLFLPWFIIYDSVNALGPWPDGWSGWTRADALVPFVGWTEIVYFSAYPLVLLAPLAAVSNADLRALMIRGWLAIVLVTFTYLTIPVVVPPKPIPAAEMFSLMLRWERIYEEPVTAFPAFHVIWPMLVAPIYVRRFRWLRAVVWGLVALIAVSCLTTGMHAIADVLAGTAFGVVILSSHAIWRRMIRGCETIAESWREWRVGRLRLINHGLYAGLAGLVGAPLIVAAAGEKNIPLILGIIVAAVAGAGLWAQWVEGGPELLRPYGFYGAVFGVIVAVLLAGTAGADVWRLLASFALGAPFVQAIGRLRCLVQGCCHGRPSSGEIGMRTSHPESRIVRLSHLGGVALHATQLYSILSNLLIGGLLVRLWVLHTSLGFIAGAWLILSGLQRFVEEQYRGEPQTPLFGGLRLYQWMAIGSLVVGAILTSASSPPAPSFSGISVVIVAFAVAVSLFLVVAYGVDVPGSTRRFSRLV